jgi:hypothetical protein
MSIIEAATVKVGTMADGTLRLTLDIEPRNAKAAFGLFGAPGTPVGIAALNLRQSARPEPEPEPEKPKGGHLAKLAAQWCNDPAFWRWCTDTFLSADPVHNAEEAAGLVRYLCGVESRAELDGNPGAKAAFDRQFRIPYSEHLKQTATA